MNDEKQHTYIVYAKIPVGSITAKSEEEAREIMERVHRPKYPGDLYLEESVVTAVRNQGDE